MSVIEILGGESVVDFPVASPGDLALLAERGIPRESIEHLVDYLGIPLSSLGGYLNVTMRSLHRYKKTQLLSSNVSDHLIQLAVLFDLGEKVLGKKKFQTWLSLPNLALGNVKPVERLKTATGIRTVSDEFIRIEYSVFAYGVPAKQETVRKRPERVWGFPGWWALEQQGDRNSVHRPKPFPGFGRVTGSPFHGT